MKKLLITCALIVLGMLSAIAAAKPKQVVKATKITKGKGKNSYILTTESGEKIKTFAWGKFKDRVKDIFEKNQTATFTITKTKNGKNNMVINVKIDGAGSASKAATTKKSNGDGTTFTASKIKKIKYGYEFTTDSGEKFKAFAWGREEVVDALIKSGDTATFTMVRTPNGKANKITKIVKGKAGAGSTTKKATKAKTQTKSGGNTFTSSKVKKQKFTYIFTTDTGEKIKAYVWGKQRDQLKSIMKNSQTATYTMKKTKKGNNKIIKIEVVD